MYSYGIICALAALFAWSSNQKDHDLVEIKNVIPEIVLDIKYATEDNFTKEVIYASPQCHLLAHVADALANVQEELADYGLGLKVWDGYRPMSAQRKMWDIVKDTPQQIYVADPGMGGKHTRGTAIDCTLIDLATAQELKMPTEFDNFTERAWRSYNDMSDEAKANRQLLEDVMTAYGFIGLPHEWWHFDYYDWQEHEPLDI